MLASHGPRVITPLGTGTRAFWESLLAENVAVAPLTRFNCEGFPSRIAAQIDDFDPAEYLTKRRVQWTDRFSQLAVAAAKLAVDDAHFAVDGQSAEVGVYTGSSVRILGVPVGKVTKITPHGTSVTVEMTYDGKYKVPADAFAAVVPPSIVGDRYIQLTPAYTSGPVMKDKAQIPLTRTALPAELDDIFQSLDDLNKSLGLPAWVNHMAFDAPTLDDLEDRKRHWREHGLTVAQIDHGFCMSIYATDPNGIMVEFCCTTRQLDDRDAAEAERLMGEAEPALSPPPVPQFFGPVPAPAPARA